VNKRMNLVYLKRWANIGGNLTRAVLKGHPAGPRGGGGTRGGHNLRRWGKGENIGASYNTTSGGWKGRKGIWQPSEGGRHFNNSFISLNTHGKEKGKFAGHLFHF